MQYCYRVVALEGQVHSRGYHTLPQGLQLHPRQALVLTPVAIHTIHTLLLGVSVATLIVYHRVTSARRMSCIKPLVSSVVQITILWAKQGRRQHVAVQ